MKKFQTNKSSNISIRKYLFFSASTFESICYDLLFCSLCTSIERTMPDELTAHYINLFNSYGLYTLQKRILLNGCNHFCTVDIICFWYTIDRNASIRAENNNIDDLMVYCLNFSSSNWISFNCKSSLDVATGI